MKAMLVCPFINYGGAEKQFRKLVEVLSCDGNVDFDVVSLSKWDCELYGKKNISIFSGILSTDVKKEKYMRFFKLPFLFMSIMSFFIKRNYNVIYTYSLYCMPLALLIRLVSKVIGRKVTIIYSERIYNNAVRYSLKIPYLYSFFDKIVVNSDELYLKFTEAGCASVNVVRNFVEPVEFKKCVRTTNEQIVIGIPARINSEKNQLFLFDVLSKYEFQVKGIRIRINLYGEIDNVDYFNKLKFFNHIMTHVESEKLYNIYEQCDLICLPSLYEGTSNVILECMINKMDFICSDIEANRNIPVNRNNTFNFTELDLIKVITEYIDGLKVSELREENYNVCYEKYSVDNFKFNIHKLFSDLL
jgi:glycosyltransferase involved in cell wall biosynthesis